MSEPNPYGIYCKVWSKTDEDKKPIMEKEQKNELIDTIKRRPVITTILLIMIVWMFGGMLFGGGDVNPSSQVVQNKTTQCLSVPSVVVEWIEGGLVDNSSLKNVQAVKSNDFNSVYFVSGYLQNPDLGDTGTIATFSLNNITFDDSSRGRLVLAIDDVAKEFSEDWFHGDRTGAQFHITMSDDGARESQKCLDI